MRLDPLRVAEREESLRMLDRICEGSLATCPQVRFCSLLDVQQLNPRLSALACAVMAPDYCTVLLRNAFDISRALFPPA